MLAEQRSLTITARQNRWVYILLGIILCLCCLLFLIIIPRVMNAGVRPRYVSMMYDLQRLREAIAQFQADTGVWPAQLKDLVAPAGSTPKGTPRGKYKGPYLTPHGCINNTGIPANPYARTPDGENLPNIADHWLYNPQDGSVISAVNGTTRDGRPFSQL